VEDSSGTDRVTLGPLVDADVCRFGCLVDSRLRVFSWGGSCDKVRFLFVRLRNLEVSTGTSDVGASDATPLPR